MPIVAATFAGLSMAACREPALTRPPDDEAVLVVRAPTPVFAGRVVLVRLTALWTSGREAEGGVQLSASAGTFDAATVALERGEARAQWSCPVSDASCLGTVLLEARWEGATSAQTITVLAPPDAGGGLPDEDAGGEAETPDAGVPDAGFTDDPLLADAGFVCGDWDGGVHPGYTGPLGQPLATGCSGEAIDYVPLAAPSPTVTHVCGSVELAEPVTEPVVLHGLFQGPIRFAGGVVPCCDAPRCLRDPRRITFRFDVEEMHGVFGLGVKWNARTRSQFGFYAGTVAAPAVNLGDATPLEVPFGAGTMTGIDFGIGPGWRP